MFTVTVATGEVPPVPVHVMLYVLAEVRLPVDCVPPAIALAPLHDPVAVHEVVGPPDTVQVSVEAVLFATGLGAAVRVTVAKRAGFPVSSQMTIPVTVPLVGSGFLGGCLPSQPARERQAMHRTRSQRRVFMTRSGVRL